MRKQSFAEDFMSVWIAFICPTFKFAFTPRLQCMLLIPVSVAFGYFLGPMALFMGPPNSAKCAYPCIFGPHGTIHIFKNYFATVFSVFSNKQYLNKPHDRP